jgi:hypothetical protein
MARRKFAKKENFISKTFDGKMVLKSIKAASAFDAPCIWSIRMSVFFIQYS